MTSSSSATSSVSEVVALAYTVAVTGPATVSGADSGAVVYVIAHGPACDTWSSLTQGASSPAEPDGTDTPPIDHWSIGRPHGAPLGLHTRVSPVATGTEADPVTVPSTPLIGAEPVTVPSAPLIGGVAVDVPVVVPVGLAAGAEVASVPPAPKYRLVGVEPVNG